MSTARIINTNKNTALPHRVKKHPKDYTGYPFVSTVVVIRNGKKVLINGVVFKSHILGGRVAATISVLVIKEGDDQLLECINRWDRTKPLDFYLVWCDFNIIGRVLLLPTVTVYEIIGMLYSHPPGKYKIKRRNRVKKERK